MFKIHDQSLSRYPLGILMVCLGELTWTPSPGEDLARDTVCQRNGSKPKSNQSLSRYQAVNVPGARCNSSAQKGENARANHDRLPGLKGVGSRRDDRTNDGLHKGECIWHPSPPRGIPQVFTYIVQLYGRVSPFRSSWMQVNFTNEHTTVGGPCNARTCTRFKRNMAAKA